MPNTVHSISIPSSTRHLGKVRRFVERYAIEADFPDEIVNSLQLAVDEACANIIEHAYDHATTSKDDEVIDIDVIIKPDRFIVRIRDHGRAFEIKNYSEPDILKYARNKRTGGFGVHLMRRLMDQVEYRTRGKSNECCLIKYRPVADKAAPRSASRQAASRKAASRKTVNKKSTPKRASATKAASSAKKKPSTKAAAKKGSAKKAATGKASAQKATAKKTTAKKAAVKKAAATKATAKKSAAKKPSARKSTAKKAVAKKKPQSGNARKPADKKRAENKSGR